MDRLLIVIGFALLITAYVVGVSLAGMLIFASAIIVAGYGAGLMMDTPEPPQGNKH